MEASAKSEIPPGTLYMLVLKTLARLGSMHGYGIAQHIQKTSEDLLAVEEGSLYPTLQRMLLKGGSKPSGANRKIIGVRATTGSRVRVGRNWHELCAWRERHG